MCYLVAKDRNAHGCFALKTTHGKHLVELKREQSSWLSRSTTGNNQSTDSIWRVCTLSFCRYRAGISDPCKRTSSIKTCCI